MGNNCCEANKELMAVLHFPNDQQFVLIYDLIIIVVVMYFSIVVNAFSLD